MAAIPRNGVSDGSSFRASGLPPAVARANHERGIAGKTPPGEQGFIWRNYLAKRNWKTRLRQSAGLAPSIGREQRRAARPRPSSRSNCRHPGGDDG
jgi:hypothetical protein